MNFTSNGQQGKEKLLYFACNCHFNSRHYQRGLIRWGDLDQLSNLTCCHRVRSNVYKKPHRTLIGCQSGFPLL